MPLLRLCRGAYRKVAPLAFLGLASGALAVPLCPPDRVDERVQVAYVYDGDTVRLSDGRKVRLIGVDTPEIGRKGAPSEPLALEAQRALESRLHSAGNTAGLRYDAERHDRYGRLLAHLYLPDGSDLAAELLASGLASRLVIPPNLWNQRCFAEQEGAARAARRGLWNLPSHRGVESSDLKPNSHGFRRVFGQVVRIGESKKSLWLNLQGGLAIRIPREDLIHFSEVDLRRLRGRRIEVRGRVYAEGDRLLMVVQHPSALDMLR